MRTHYANVVCGSLSSPAIPANRQYIIGGFDNATAMVMQMIVGKDRLDIKIWVFHAYATLCKIAISNFASASGASLCMISKPWELSAANARVIGRAQSPCAAAQEASDPPRVSA
jgi:hypothetical protein